MLSLPPTWRVFVAVDPCDMRRSFDGLAGAVRALGLDPVSGHVYLFFNRRRRLAKALWFDGSGWCLLSKRLERGSFQLPRLSGDEKMVPGAVGLWRRMVCDGTPWRLASTVAADKGGRDLGPRNCAKTRALDLHAVEWYHGAACRVRSQLLEARTSLLWPGVDGLQFGKSLALCVELANRYGFQYLVTMNTDDMPKELPIGFQVEDHAVNVWLSDATEDGGLFGFGFD
ncbi:MAG: IS66 family insertion sequence element accessory protein TnpB [Polyangiaceae bacterium]|nr:IS66 family insertion sequence element accessory protein TnpB [Polyangiaceae bacterium]